jgi:hypothetical protein
MLLLLIIDSITHSVVLGLHSHIHKHIQEYQFKSSSITRVWMKWYSLVKSLSLLLSTYIQQLARVSNCMCLAMAPQHLSTIADCHIVLWHNLTAFLLAHILLNEGCSCHQMKNWQSFRLHYLLSLPSLSWAELSQTQTPKQHASTIQTTTTYGLQGISLIIFHVSCRLSASPTRLPCRPVVSQFCRNRVNCAHCRTKLQAIFHQTCIIVRTLWNLLNKCVKMVHFVSKCFRASLL